MYNLFNCGLDSKLEQQYSLSFDWLNPLGHVSILSHNTTKTQREMIELTEESGRILVIIAVT